jgi:hypothetical protein
LKERRLGFGGLRSLTQWVNIDNFATNFIDVLERAVEPIAGNDKLFVTATDAGVTWEADTGNFNPNTLFVRHLDSG